MGDRPAEQLGVKVCEGAGIGCFNGSSPPHTHCARAHGTILSRLTSTRPVHLPTRIRDCRKISSARNFFFHSRTVPCSSRLQRSPIGNHIVERMTLAETRRVDLTRLVEIGHEE
jgi:hypothetical protein